MARLLQLSAFMQTLEGFRVAVLATDGVEESELQSPVDALRKAGASVDIIAPGDVKEIQGFKHHDKSSSIPVSKKLKDAKPDDYDAVLLPGGALNADHLRIDKDAQRFVKANEENGKPLAVICHGSWILASTGLAKGRKITSYHTIQDDLKNAGADWVEQQVVVDRNWVSSRKPADLPAFNRAMIELFSKSAQGKKAA